MVKSQEVDLKVLNIPFLISGFAHMRFILSKIGIDIDEGIVVFLSEDVEKEKILHMFEVYGGKRKYLQGKKMPNGYNFQTVLVEYKSLYDTDIWHKYMICEQYLPIIISVGVMPQVLREFSNIIILEENLEGYEDIEIKEQECKEFFEYLHKNINSIITRLKLFREKIELENPDLTMLQIGLMLVVMSYQDFVFNQMSKLFSAEEQNAVFDRIRKVTEDSMEGIDIKGVIRRCLEKYVDSTYEVKVGEVNRVETELLQAVEDENAILYDSDFYYISEKVLCKATKHVQHMMSSIAIKKALFDEGIIECNEAKNSYTIKKQFIPAYGGVMRRRFLKINRKKFDTENSLTLIERSEKPCTSVSVKENPVI